jgi:predicted nucleotidyltransferase
MEPVGMQNFEMIDHLAKAGFKYPKDLIHVFQGGSHQHGASIPGKVSDIDLFGIYIEPPIKALGVSEETHFTGSTQDRYERNRPGDEDYKCYTLQRWAGLACKGNPTILGFLYTQWNLPGVWGDIIVPNKNLFKARSHAKAFLGYAKGQVSRLDGTIGSGKHGQRPELEKAFGYDTKAAMHLMRLLFEAEEYMLTGEITYPRPEKDVLLDIRLGKWSWDKLFAEYFAMEKRVETAMEKSTLPEHVDRDKISGLLCNCYLQHWKDNGLIDNYII